MRRMFASYLVPYAIELTSSIAIFRNRYLVSAVLNENVNIALIAHRTNWELDFSISSSSVNFYGILIYRRM